MFLFCSILGQGSARVKNSGCVPTSALLYLFKEGRRVQSIFVNLSVNFGVRKKEYQQPKLAQAH